MMEDRTNVIHTTSKHIDKKKSNANKPTDAKKIAKDGMSTRRDIKRSLTKVKRYSLIH